MGLKDQCAARQKKKIWGKSIPQDITPLLPRDITSSCAKAYQTPSPLLCSPLLWCFWWKSVTNLTPQRAITLLVFSLKYSWAIYSHLVPPALSCLLNNWFCLLSDRAGMYWQTAYILAAPTLLKLNKLTQFVPPRKKIISFGFVTLWPTPASDLVWTSLLWTRKARIVRRYELWLSQSLAFQVWWFFLIL